MQNPGRTLTEPGIEAAQLSALVRNGAVGIAGGVSGAVIMAGAVAYEDGRLGSDLLAWLAAIAAAYTLHGVLVAARRRAGASRDIRRGLRQFAAVGALEGVVWSAGIVGFSAIRPVEDELTILLLGAGVAAGAGLSFGPHLPTFLLRFGAATVPYTAWALLQGDGLHLVLALTVATYTLMSVQLVRNFNLGFIRTQTLTLENLALVEDLRAQKERAEQADAAKSQFLAAASHDLRQPVHALGLFVSALRERALDPDAGVLLDHLGEAVEAMDALFASLLDVSRLDAGVVEVRTGPVAVATLLERIRRDHEAEAAAKGLRLTVAAPDATAETDPVLLERILRNLVSNAIRYTERGGVLIAARRRQGRLQLQVWDTGPGIAEAERERVFQEFVQLANPARDRTKGLGLGLAIVRRLALLLGARIELRSVPGRGSVFAFAVPLAPAGAREIPPPPPPQARPGSILVVDDDEAIRTAMGELLGRWGHATFLAARLDEALAALAASGARPDLVICDHRLADGENGIETIARLRAAVGEMPALLITGETAPDRLAEARASGLVLLHKPIAGGKLRAAVSRLLG